MRLRVAVLASLALALVGCSRAPVYEPPAEGPKATLAFEVHSAGAPIRGVNVFKDAAHCKGPVDIPLAEQDGALKASITVPAGQDISMMLMTGLTPECIIIESFKPAEGASYLATFELRQSEGRCTSQLIQQSQGAATNISARQRRFTRPFWVTGDFCAAE